MAVVAYMGHPLGERPHDVFDNSRRDNLSNGIDWVRFLRATTRWVISYPSFVFMAADDSEVSQPRALVDQMEILSRSDVYVLVGGAMAPHMKIEFHRATTRSSGPIPVVDLLDLGRVPPWDRKDMVAKEIARRAAAVGLRA